MGVRELVLSVEVWSTVRTRRMRITPEDECSTRRMKNYYCQRMCGLSTRRMIVTPN